MNTNELLTSCVIIGCLIATFKVLVSRGNMLNFLWQPVVDHFRGFMNWLTTGKTSNCTSPYWVSKLFTCTYCILFWWSFILWALISGLSCNPMTFEPFMTAAIAKFFYNQITA